LDQLDHRGDATAARTAGAAALGDTHLALRARLNGSPNRTIANPMTMTNDHSPCSRQLSSNRPEELSYSLATRC
jgi:hypothetical protein